MLITAEDLMSYLAKQTRREPQPSFGFKADKKLRSDLEMLSKIWGVSMSFVMRRLVEVGVDGAFAELGGRPETEEQIQAMAEAVRRKFAGVDQ